MTISDARIDAAVSPPAPVEMGRRSEGHVLIGDCVVFTGAPPAFVPLAPGLAAPWVVLVHTMDARTPESRLLMAERTAEWTRGCANVVVGLAMPMRRLLMPTLLESTTLARTTLVRVSRHVLPELIATPPASGAVAMPVEEFLITMMQGIIRENPRVVTGVRRDNLLPGDIVAMVDARHHDPYFDVATMARELHISRRQLYRYAPEGTGLAGMIAERRLRSAISVLSEHPHLTLSTVAQLSGFRDAASMRAQFLRRLGVTPREYREGD